jgi:hypothetical protein
MPALIEATLEIRQTDRYMIVASGAYSLTRRVHFDLPPPDPVITDATSVGHSDGRRSNRSEQSQRVTTR